MYEMNKLFFKIILLIGLLFSSFNSIAQELKTTPQIYQDFGRWNLNIGDNKKITVHAYSTVETIIREAKNDNEKTQLIRKYELYLVSESVFEGDTTSTWLYGARIYLNDDELTVKQFPEGFLVSVDTKPTLIYWYETADDNEKELTFNVSWSKAVYEPRVRK